MTAFEKNFTVTWRLFVLRTQTGTLPNFKFQMDFFVLTSDFHSAFKGTFEAVYGDGEQISLLYGDFPGNDCGR